MERRAKILATLGPASWDEETLGQLLAAGVDAVRLNLSHGSREEHRGTCRRIRQVSADQGRLTPVVFDLMGPRFRLGELPQGPVQLERGARVTLGTGPDLDAPGLPLGDPGIIEHLRPGERILIDHGLVELQVESKEGARISARVTAGGQVSTRKGINLPDTDLPFTISDKDRGDLKLAAEEGADYLAASYVGRAQDLAALRQAVGEAGGEVPLVAKLERRQAIDNLEEIVAAADAVMVARGDLGVELPLHRVPVLQKEIIDAGRRAGKPVIVATQMLESMIDHPRPTRAEASDVANAVFDGADALMLSGETAAGRYPVESVATMVRIICEAERHRAARREETSGEPYLPALSPDLGSTRDPEERLAETVAAAAVLAARRLGVGRLIAFSQGGFTARILARYRPSAPILAFTTDREVARRLELVWGVRTLVMEGEVHHHDEVVELVESRLLSSGLSREGEPVIILMGDPIPERPLTNLMRIHRLRSGEGA